MSNVVYNNSNFFSLHWFLTLIFIFPFSLPLSLLTCAKQAWVLLARSILLLSLIVTLPLTIDQLIEGMKECKINFSLFFSISLSPSDSHLSPDSCCAHAAWVSSTNNPAAWDIVLFHCNSLITHSSVSISSLLLSDCPLFSFFSSHRCRWSSGQRVTLSLSHSPPIDT